MKASTFFKAYVWAEVLFMGYLVLKPKSQQPPAKGSLDDLTDRLKEEIDHATQDP